MSWPGELVRRIGVWGHKRRSDVELEADRRLHLELRQQEKVESVVDKTAGLSLPSSVATETNCPIAPRSLGELTCWFAKFCVSRSF
jgi:hypothetical protein